MGRKPTIDPKNLPPWFHVIEYRRSKGTTDKKYRDTYNSKTYRSMQAVAEAFGLGDNKKIPCPRPLNIRKEDGSSAPIPMVEYTKIPEIPAYLGKDIGSDSRNFEEGEEQFNTTRVIPGIMKEEKQKEIEETGHAASHFLKEEEIANKIEASSADAASMKPPPANPSARAPPQSPSHPCRRHHPSLLRPASSLVLSGRTRWCYGCSARGAQGSPSRPCILPLVSYPWPPIAARLLPLVSYPSSCRLSSSSSPPLRCLSSSAPISNQRLRRCIFSPAQQGRATTAESSSGNASIPEQPPQRSPPPSSSRTTASAAQLSLLWLVLITVSSGLSSIPSTPQFLLHIGEGGGWEMAQENKIDAVVLSVVERGAPIVLVHPRFELMAVFPWEKMDKSSPGRTASRFHSGDGVADDRSYNRILAVFQQRKICACN